MTSILANNKVVITTLLSASIDPNLSNHLTTFLVVRCQPPPSLVYGNMPDVMPMLGSELFKMEG